VDRRWHVRGPEHCYRYPSGFEAYTTVVLPYGGEGQDEHDRAVLGLLSEQSQASRGGWGISTRAPMTSSSPMRPK
jgi:hypothetical protein